MTIYINDPKTEDQIRHAAETAGVSIDEFVLNVLRDRVAHELDTWPAGFFDDTYGTLAADPIERLTQGEFDKRDELR